MAKLMDYTLFLFKRKVEESVYRGFSIIKTDKVLSKSFSYSSFIMDKLHMNVYKVDLALIDSKKPLQLSQAGLIVYDCSGRNFSATFETVDIAKKFKKELEKIFEGN